MHLYMQQQHVKKFQYSFIHIPESLLQLASSTVVVSRGLLSVLVHYTGVIKTDFTFYTNYVWLASCDA